MGALKNEGLDFSHTQQLPGTITRLRAWWLLSAAYRCLPHLRQRLRFCFQLLPAEHLSGRFLKNSGYQNYFVQGANLRFAVKMCS